MELFQISFACLLGLGIIFQIVVFVRGKSLKQKLVLGCVAMVPVELVVIGGSLILREPMVLNLIAVPIVVYIVFVSLVLITETRKIAKVFKKLLADENVVDDDINHDSP